MTYGFGSPGLRVASAGSFVFDPSKIVWFEISTSAPAWRRIEPELPQAARDFVAFAAAACRPLSDGCAAATPAARAAAAISAS